MVVTQRSRSKWCCVAICLVGAALCAFNRAPVLALMHVAAAVVLYRVSFGTTPGSHDIDALIARLRDARNAEPVNRPAMMRAVVTTRFILLSAPETSATGFWVRLWRAARGPVSLVFRDEMTDAQWRHIATALRHQPRPSEAMGLADQSRWS